jgi:ABC-type glycerol-3-phosphate transport system permease component
LLGDGRADGIVNSLIVAILSTILAVTFGALGAYASTPAGVAGRVFAAWGVGSRMAPPVLIALPIAAVVAGTAWAGSIPVLVVVYAAFNLPYVLWMMCAYLNDVPPALIESALVAGHTRNEVLRSVIWPMTRGGLAATAAVTFLLAWNELALALVLAGDANAMLPARLALHDRRPELWGELAALSVIGALPALVATALLHRRLARTLSFGIVRD